MEDCSTCYSAISKYSDFMKPYNLSLLFNDIDSVDVIYFLKKNNLSNIRFLIDPILYEKISKLSRPTCIVRINSERISLIGDLHQISSIRKLFELILPDTIKLNNFPTNSYVKIFNRNFYQVDELRNVITFYDLINNNPNGYLDLTIDTLLKSILSFLPENSFDKDLIHKLKLEIVREYNSDNRVYIILSISYPEEKINETIKMKKALFLCTYINKKMHICMISSENILPPYDVDEYSGFFIKDNYLYLSVFKSNLTDSAIFIGIWELNGDIYRFKSLSNYSLPKFYLDNHLIYQFNDFNLQGSILYMSSCDYFININSKIWNKLGVNLPTLDEEYIKNHDFYSFYNYYSGINSDSTIQVIYRLDERIFISIFDYKQRKTLKTTEIKLDEMPIQFLNVYDNIFYIVLKKKKLLLKYNTMLF